MEKHYSINGKNYAQRPLVLGQIAQLVGLVKDVSSTGADVVSEAIATVAEATPEALAILLIPEGCTDLSTKDVNAIAREIAWHMGVDQALEVASDFLDCNDVSSIRSRLGVIVEKFQSLIPSTSASSSSQSSSNSPGEMSQSGIASSGPSPQSLPPDTSITEGPSSTDPLPPSSCSSEPSASQSETPEEPMVTAADMPAPTR